MAVQGVTTTTMAGGPVRAADVRKKLREGENGAAVPLPPPQPLLPAVAGPEGRPQAGGGKPLSVAGTVLAPAPAPVTAPITMPKLEPAVQRPESGNGTLTGKFDQALRRLPQSGGMGSVAPVFTPQQKDGWMAPGPGPAGGAGHVLPALDMLKGGGAGVMAEGPGLRGVRDGALPKVVPAVSGPEGLRSLREPQKAGDMNRPGPAPAPAEAVRRMLSGENAGGSGKVPGDALPGGARQSEGTVVKLAGTNGGDWFAAPGPNVGQDGGVSAEAVAKRAGMLGGVDAKPGNGLAAGTEMGAKVVGAVPAQAATVSPGAGVRPGRGVSPASGAGTEDAGQGITGVAAPGAGKKSLPADQRQRLEADLAAAEREGMGRLGGRLREVAATGDAFLAGDDARQAGNRAKRRLRELEVNPAGGLAGDDLNDLHHGKEGVGLVRRIHALREQLKADDAEVLRERKVAEREALRKNAPEAWAAGERQRLEGLDGRGLADYLGERDASLKAKKAVLEGRAAEFKKAAEGLQSDLEGLKQENARLMAAEGRAATQPGAQEGEAVTVWHPSLGPKLDQYNKKLQNWQAESAPLERLQGQELAEYNREADLARHAVGRLQTMQEGDDRAQAEGLQAVGRQAVPGAARVSQGLQAVVAEQKTRMEELQRLHPDGVPREKLEALGREMQGKQEAVYGRAEQALSAADAAYQGLKAAMKEKPFLEQALRGNVRNNLAQALNVSAEEAQRLLEDVESMDWDATLGRQGEMPRNVVQWMQGDHPKARVLSNGAVLVHPALHGDEAAYKAAVEGMRDASPEAKAQALRQWPQVQRQWAAQMAPILWAERDIPGLPSFMKWREEQIGQDQASRGRTGFTKLPMEDQVLKYVGEMKNRPAWEKHADTFTRSLVSAAGSVGSSLLGVAGMMQKVMPFSGLAGKALGVDPGEVLSGLAADWSRSNQEISAGLEVKGGLDTTGLKATALLGNIIPQVGLGGIAKGGMLLNTALAAAQSTGQVYADAYGKLRAEGKGHEAAWRATAPYAVGSGIATAVLTAAGARLGGGAGMKKGLDLAVKDPAVKAAARAAWSQQFPRLAGAGNAVRDMAVDGVMEMPDEYFNQLASALAANPQANVAEVTADFIRSSPEIMKTVAAMGALGKVAGPGPGMGKGGAASPGLAAADTGVNALREAQGAALPVDGKSLAGAEAKLPGTVNAMGVNDVKHPLVAAQALPGGGNPVAGTVAEALPLHGAVEGASPAGQVSGVDENSVKYHSAEPGAAPPPAVGSAAAAAAAAAAAQAVASVPLWEGKAPRGEAVQVLDRNPDGTWQVMLGGREMTAKESQMAVMTGMRKPDVDAFVQQHGLRQDDAAVQAPGVPLGQASHAEPGRLQKLVQRASRTLQQVMPGVTGRHGRVLEGGRQLLADAAYLQERGREFSAEEQEAILSGEGFYDPLTNRSFVFAGQVQPRAGESARAAVHRVFLHETVGHDGLAQVLAAGGRALRNFKHLVEKIRLNQPEVYAAVAQDPAYAHLEGDLVKIGLEIMGRETERRPELLQRPSVFRDMKLLLGHALAQLQIRLGLRPESAADLDRQVDLLLNRARRAAERDSRVDATHVTGDGLLFKRDGNVPAAGKEAGRGVSQARGVGHSFASIREKAALERLLGQFGGPEGALMKQVQRIAADARRFGPEVAEDVLRSLVVAQQDPGLKTARARDVVLKPLQNSARLNKCVSGLATAVKCGLAPAEVAEVLTNHARILSPHYTAENLLLDTEILEPIPGLSDLWRMLKTDSAQAKGFRYELEGAAAINRGAMGDDAKVTELSKRISVSLHGGKTKTDIDVVVKQGQNTVIYNQLKRSAKALGYGERGLEATKLWVAKALADLAKHKSHKVVYVVPPGVKIPPRIEAWLKSVQIDIVRIIHAK